MNNEEERSKQNPAIQAPILTKPKRQKLQAMEMGSDTRRRRTCCKVGFIFCFGFDLFMGFWGLGRHLESSDLAQLISNRIGVGGRKWVRHSHRRRRLHVGVGATCWEVWWRCLHQTLCGLLQIFVVGFWGLGRHLERKGKEEQEKNPCKFSFGWTKIEFRVVIFPKTKPSPLCSIFMKEKRVLCARFPAQLLCNWKSSAIYSIYTGQNGQITIKS